MSAFITRLPFRRQGSSDVSDTASDVKPPSLRSDDEKSAPTADRAILDKTDKAEVDAPEAAVSQLDAHNLLANGKEVRTIAEKCWSNPSRQGLSVAFERPNSTHLRMHEHLKGRPIETAEDIATRCISLDDDQSLVVHTIRMWTIGLGLTCFAAVLGQIFYFRPQTIFVSQLFLQVIAYVMGKAWASVLPKADRGRFWAILNPCDFNIKEHVAILIMSSTATDSALAISVFAAEELFYDVHPSYGVAIFTLLGSQLFGYGIAGLMRSFTVFPTYIVFPNLIPTVSLFDAFHRDIPALLTCQQTNGPAQKKRLRFFWTAFAIIFCWEWIPEFVAPTLTGVSIFCLANRNSAWFTRIFGGSNGNEGLGMFSLCFDWNYVGSGGGSLGALFTPFSTQVSQYIGVAICCITFSVAYATNLWNAKNFPFLSQQLFYENGTQYNQLAILNKDYSLNQTKLDIEGVPWYATSNALYYVGANLSIGASLTHVAVWYLPSITKAFKEYRSQSQPDPHYQKMMTYREVPMWWYLLTLGASFAMSMASCYAGHAQLPWWALIIAFLLAAAVFPPVLIVYAVTGFNTDVQQLAQMLGAAIVSGNSRANLYFTLYGSNSVSQARGLTRDLKLGQYTKLPPISTFVCQVVGAILQLVVMKSIINSQRAVLLSVQGTNIWSGQQVQSYNSQAVAWGALAKSMYAPGRPYFIIPVSIVIGLFVPLPFWVGHKFFPKLKLDQLVTPIMCWSIGLLSVGINSAVFGTMLIALFSQYYLRRYRATWFRKYNYLLSAGLDGGTQFMVFIATFALFGGSGKAVTMPTWALNPDSSRYNFGECKASATDKFHSID
ncbi:BZ3500_MvSof-1268-A1-R1_Chr1-1g00858 [Microbotryum saponariae]|uniref:BZ3500_MvSof-1268-A1-R1_Chr1-1g00858 protein n=1 Tax=Microbotryum saponariae TaxID=289078 RepID=A0A2X0K7I6_9BASI|nr:BZ3500_MvSof-1268-A1-R1_Chr1-1g00858 [Microbotryum saponariae]SCZ92793.1 BZ3501_MvSof-1269-A2-R1_Chr1-1g00455 [Microbotryum saponariae]